VNVKITPLDKPTFLAPMFFTKGVDNTTWQAGLERYTFGNSTPSLVWQTYDTGSYINFSGVNLPGGVKDPDLQALIDKAKVEYDHDKAKGCSRRSRRSWTSRPSRRICPGRTTSRHRRPVSRTSRPHRV
jgi:hypothetical protein